jgi:hypothetical protein
MLNTHHTISHFQTYVCRCIREARTIEEQEGWIRWDAWINDRKQVLAAQYKGVRPSSLPAFLLLDGYY